MVAAAPVLLLLSIPIKYVGLEHFRLEPHSTLLLIKYNNDIQRRVWGCCANLRGTPRGFLSSMRNGGVFQPQIYRRYYATMPGTLGQYGLLNMPIGLSIGWGMAHRYLLSPAVGG